MKKVLSIIFLMVAALPLAAQVAVEARIDSLEMLIGEQVHVTLSVTAGEEAKVVFPEYGPQQMLTPGVEVLASSDTDKKAAGDSRATYSRVYTLTSFDGKLYYLPPFTVSVDGKEYKSQSLALKVLEVAVDTTNYEKFYGPIEVQDNPFSWREWSYPFWLSVLMLVLGALGCYIYIRLRTGKPFIASIKIVKKVPPHQKAMKEIERIKAEKMVQSEDQKEYYTQLTETLRNYIRERYGFNAMEMTSSEIIERLSAAADGTSIEELRELFRTADLVKFAKYSTLINENDMNLVNAIEFINHTKQENVPAEEVVRPQLSAEEARSAKARNALEATVGMIVVACGGLLVYIIYYVFQLLY